MRRNALPVRPKSDNRTTMRAPEMPTRKMFNCIVDDTALIAGVKKSTRDGIRKWVANDAIRLFVPLHTLAQLHRLKKGSERLNADALETVKWLDDITSMPAVETSGRVQLEGGDEAYATWAEVEEFLLPDTLLSMDDTEESEDDDYPEDLESSFNALDVSDGTSMSSTHSLDDTPKTPDSPKSGYSINSSAYSHREEALAMGTPDLPARKSGSHERPTSVDSTKLGNSSLYIRKPDSENAHSYNTEASPLHAEIPNRATRDKTDFPRAEKSQLTKSVVPAYLQPLFNHTMWRINKESNPNAALASFILLTNDQTKQTIASKFGIRAKRLEQLRDAVSREEREYRNRLTVYKLESEMPKPRTLAEKPIEQKPAPRPKSSHSTHSTAEIDEDDEDEVLLRRAPRGPQAQTANAQRIWDPNEFGRTNQMQGSRGGRGGHGSPRGRGMPRGGRGAFAPRGAYAPPGPSFRAPPAPRHDPNQPIDPDSFTRPVPRTTPMRGARRKLWEPN